VPANATVYGNATVLASGGYTNSGFLELTPAVASQSAGFILNDLDAGVPVVSFTASYKCLIGGGGYTGADGISFNFAPDLPAGPIVSVSRMARVITWPKLLVAEIVQRRFASEKSLLGLFTRV